LIFAEVSKIIPEEKTIATEAKSQPQKSLVRSFLITAIKFVLAATVIYFAGRQLVSHWAEVSQHHWTINPLLIILSVVFHLITFAVLSKMWCLLMKAFGFNVPLKHGFKIAYIASLGRYIPGKIWQVFGMVYLLKQINVNKEVALASWGVATIFGLPPAFLVGFITIYFYPQMLSTTLGSNPGVGPFVAVVVTFAASLLLVFAPDKTMALFNWILKTLRRPRVQFKLEKKIALQVYLGYFIGWTCYGISFYTFMNAIMVKPEIPVIAGVGSFVMAYTIGYLAVFSPGGLGARELVLTIVLSPFLGSIASGVAVAARIWNLASEFIAAMIALLIKLEKKKE
jgi:uncharacterized membrane protein YbhN (UPF0104 family)